MGEDRPTNPSSNTLNDEERAKVVTIDYTNWRGERRKRQVIPVNIGFGVTQWHREPQWVLYAIDLEEDKVKGFSMKSIHEWIP